MAKEREKPARPATLAPEWLEAVPQASSPAASTTMLPRFSRRVDSQRSQDLREYLHGSGVGSERERWAQGRQQYPR
jgi:hypothetical protein